MKHPTTTRVVLLFIGLVLMTSLIPMHNAALAVGPPQITYIRFKRNITNIFVAICINSADGYRRTRLEVQGDGSTAWQLVDTFGQLNGCVEGVLYFTQVTGNEHLVVNIDAWNTGGSTTARFDLFPTSSDQLNNCAVQSDASSPLIRDPRYRWDTAAGLACAFVDPAAVGQAPPTPTPILPGTPSPPPPPPPATYALEVYNDPSYAGSMCFSNAPMTANIHFSCNDRISSLKLRAGWSVRVFRDVSRQGPSRCITASDTNLADNTFEDGSPLNDAISSFVLYQQTPCPTTPVPPDHPPVELEGIEITQAIQTWRNNSPLIANRRTIVRAHIRSSAFVYGVIAELVGTRNGQPLPGSPLRPSNAGGRVNVRPNPDRLVLGDSFVFDLPASWRNGEITLEVRGVTDPLVCKDISHTANDCRATVRFRSSPVPEVRLVGMIWNENGQDHVPSDGDIAGVARQIETTFPIASLSWARTSDVRLPFDGPPTEEDHETIIHLNLMRQRQLDWCIWFCKRYYLGVLVDQPKNTSNGVAILSSYIAYAFYKPGRLTHPHEFGHALGRRHVLCRGDEQNTDGSYPIANGFISNSTSGNDAFYGLNIHNLRDIHGPTSCDLMGYEFTPGTRWISEYTFDAIHKSLVARYGASLATANAQLAVSANQPALVVSGSIEGDGGTGAFGPIYQVNAPADAPLPQPGAYTIRYEDAQGQELASFPFTAEPTSEGNQKLFAMVLPWDARASLVVLRAGGRTLDIKPVTANAPVVAITSPSAGATLNGAMATLSWTASDRDGDPLTFAVQYSVDGGTTWETLVSDWTQTSYTLDLAKLPGSTNAAIRVLASDGIRTTAAQVGSLTTPFGTPVPSIAPLAFGSLFVEAQTIVLEGSAQDKDDGQLAGDQLRWVSSLDGELGAGASLALDVSLLTEGEHTITLSATDSRGQTGSTTTTIQVARARPTLPPSLAVAPMNLGFLAQEGAAAAGTEQLALRNEGDGDSLSWTASADQPWIKLGATSGDGESLSITADASSLAAGTYTGTITVTGAGGDAGTHKIPVTLVVTERPTIYLPLLRR